MAQTSFTYRKLDHGSGKYLIHQVGKHAFSTTGLTINLSSVIRTLVYAEATPILPTMGSGEATDFIDFPSATISNARTIAAARQKSGKSGLNFYYHLAGY